MKLESSAREGFDLLGISLSTRIKDERAVIDTGELLFDVLDLVDSGVLVEEIACASQRALAEKMADLAVIAARSHNTDVIGVTGGVFYNEFISEVVKDIVLDEGYEFVQHVNTCAGDGSVSMGQCAVAGWQRNMI